MKCFYSVVRFVPDTARGEFVNVGVIVGSEDSNEWDSRLVAKLTRARRIDDNEVSEVVGYFFEKIGREIDQFSASIERSTPPRRMLTVQWLLDLHRNQHNLVQVTRPIPMRADSVQEALDRVFSILVVDPASRRSEIITKHRALSVMKEAYRLEGIVATSHLRERVRLSTPHHHKAGFDFAVVNGRVVQLAQAWSFQVAAQEELAENIRAWAWTVRDLRASGGSGSTAAEGEFDIPRDVGITAIYVPPRDDAETETLAAAHNVFQELQVEALPIDRANVAARRARDLLEASAAG